MCVEDDRQGAFCILLVIKAKYMTVRASAGVNDDDASDDDDNDDDCSHRVKHHAHGDDDALFDSLSSSESRRTAPY